MSASRILRRLDEDKVHYNVAFLFRLSRGDYDKATERWCNSVFRQDIVPKLGDAVDIAEGKEFRTLGVGSGSGEVECHLLKQILQKFPRIINHVIEPSKDLSDMYKTYVSENSEKLQGIDFKWHLETLQEYKARRDSAGITTKFHFISTVNSMYYVDNMGIWLNYLYDMLEVGGVLLVNMNAEVSGQGHLNREFLQQPWWYNRDEVDKSRDCTGTTIAVAQAHFDSRGIPHEDFVVPIRSDISQCFNTEPSAESDLLLDFYSNIIDFRRNVSSDIYERFLQVLASDDCSERQGKRVLFIDDKDTMVVYKM